jgi:putative oxidoreductase
MMSLVSRRRRRSGDDQSVSLRDLCSHSRSHPSRRKAAMSERRHCIREEKHVTHIDSETKHETKLLIPGLESFYAVAIPLAWPIVRIAVGWNLLVHGWGKVTRGPSAYIRAFVEQGFDPALPWIWAALIIEFVGGIALIIGLFTRFFAAAAAVEMLIITILYWKAGFSWLNRGYEYTLLWGLVCFAIALRGAGPYSVDRRIGVEL